MFIIISQLLRSPKVLPVEVMVISFVISLVLVTLLNSMEIRHHPERFRKASLAIFVGIAVATGLSAIHSHIPFWQFGLSVYLGMTAGFVAFLVAPSKIRIDRFMKQISGESSSHHSGPEPEPAAEREVRLPDTVKPAVMGRRWRANAEEATSAPAILPRKVSSTFNQQRLIAQILELSEEAGREGVPLKEIIEALENSRYTKSDQKKAG